MNIDLQRDWPAYLLLGAVIVFFLYVIIKSNLDERKNKKDKIEKKTDKP